MTSKTFLTFFIPTLYFFAVILIQKTGISLGFGLNLAIFGLIIALLGIILWIFGFINLGIKSFSVLPKAKKLQTGGVYKFFRHPIYVGIIFTLLGLSLANGSKEGLIYTILVMIPLNIIRAFFEEKKLIKEFGQDYLNYRKKTII